MKLGFHSDFRLRGFAVFGVALFAASSASADFDRETTSIAGKKLTISYFVPAASGGEVETETASPEITKANVCGDDSLDLKTAILWMPEHDHGSAPVEVVPNTETTVRCYWLMGTEFFMAGDWQVKVELANEDKAVFNVKIPEN